MSGEIEEKISGYFDGTLGEEEFAKLSDWIKADPANARQFAREAMLHDRLQSEMQAAAKPSEEGKIIRFPVQWLAAAAAAVALVI